MKKITLLLLSFFCLSVLPCKADNLYENILETDALIAKESLPDAEDARNQAKELLKTRSQNLRKQNFPTLRQRTSKINTEDTYRYQAAPFGLVWGASVTDTKNQGVELQSIEEKDYVNSFNAKHLPKPIAEFDRINLTFGENNELWRIIAYGQLNEDDSSCSVGLRQYKIYASLLAKKYGKAQEYYTPAMITVETTDSRSKPTTEQKAAAIGNPEFCSQLEAGSAVLYSTFENAEVGAALALNVDGSGKSYIVIDYKNLRILRAKENQTLEAL